MMLARREVRQSARFAALSQRRSRLQIHRSDDDLAVSAAGEQLCALKRALLQSECHLFKAGQGGSRNGIVAVFSAAESNAIGRRDAAIIELAGADQAHGRNAIRAAIAAQIEPDAIVLARLKRTLRSSALDTRLRAPAERSLSGRRASLFCSPLSPPAPAELRAGGRWRSE